VLALPPFPIEGATGSLGFKAVLDGFGYLAGQPVLLMSFLVDIIAMIFGMPRAPFPEIAHLDFGGPEGGGLAFALLFAGIPLGAVIGGVFSGWVSRVERQGVAALASVVVWGLAMLGFGAAVSLADTWRWPMLVAAVLMLVLGGAADMASAAFGRACCRVRRPTLSAAGCRVSSPSWSWAVRASLTSRTGSRGLRRDCGHRCGRRAAGRRAHGAGCDGLPGLRALPGGGRDRPRELRVWEARAGVTPVQLSLSLR
jgi:hypothetical protein